MEIDSIEPELRAFEDTFGCRLCLHFFTDLFFRGKAPLLDLKRQSHRKTHPDRWWTVAELAESAGVSTAQLRRDFLRHTGMLPKNYIEQFKMHRAAEMLHAGASIADTARELGYRDVDHFARRFRARFGTPPGRFRAQLERD